MELSIVIVNWNAAGDLRRCLNSLRESVTGIDFEIIVVDNNSSDESTLMVKREFPAVRLIANPVNAGFARANNQGVAASRGADVLFLNPDTIIGSAAVEKMVEFLRNHSEVGALGCKIVRPDGAVQNTCARNFPTPANQFFEIAMLRRLFPRIPLFGHSDLSYWDHGQSRYVDCLVGACLMVRREVLDVVGGWNEKYFMYGEDIELCYKIKQAGWKLYYLAEEEIVHLGAGCVRKMEDRFSTVLLRETCYQFMRSNYGSGRARLYRALTLAGALLRVITILLGMGILKLLGKKHRDFSPHTFRKYGTILKWSFGLENTGAGNFRPKKDYR